MSTRPSEETTSNRKCCATDGNTGISTKEQHKPNARSQRPRGFGPRRLPAYARRLRLKLGNLQSSRRSPFDQKNPAMKAAIIAGCVMLSVLCAAPEAHAQSNLNSAFGGSAGFGTRNLGPPVRPNPRMSTCLGDLRNAPSGYAVARVKYCLGRRR